MDREPTEKEIKDYIRIHPGESYYTARERLREMAYGKLYNKPEGMSWGDFWKSY